LRGKFKFPEFKEGYRYRFVVGGMSHVGAGEGYKIFINGKEFLERPRGVGKREGAKLVGKHIDKSWWPDFSGSEVDIAHISFMNIHRGVKSRHLMLWVQEMKLPPLDDDQIRHSATVVPMVSSAWQALQDPDDADRDPNEGKFVWDGKVKPNADVLGTWEAHSYVNMLEDFDPERPTRATSAPAQKLAIAADGTTGDPLWIWSGDTLMDLKNSQALKMMRKEIDGKTYLCVEAGSFHEKNGPDWNCPWFIMKRAEE